MRIDDIPGKVTAPMPGRIRALRVKPGDKVAYGDELLVFEAMKMEMSIKSPYEGVVKGVSVVVGQSVRHGDVLVEFEQ